MTRGGRRARPPPILLMSDKGRLGNQELLQVGVYLSKMPSIRAEPGFCWGASVQEDRPFLPFLSPWMEFIFYIFKYLLFGSIGSWLPHTDSLIVVRGLRCSGARGVFVPQPGAEPTSPAVQGGSLTTRPPGSPWMEFLNDPLPKLIF